MKAGLRLDGAQASAGRKHADKLLMGYFEKLINLNVMAMVSGQNQEEVEKEPREQSGQDLTSCSRSIFHINPTEAHCERLE